MEGVSSWGFKGGCPAPKNTRSFYTTHNDCDNFGAGIEHARGTRVHRCGRLLQLFFALHTNIGHLYRPGGVGIPGMLRDVAIG